MLFEVLFNPGCSDSMNYTPNLSTLGMKSTVYMLHDCYEELAYSCFLFFFFFFLDVIDSGISVRSCKAVQHTKEETYIASITLLSGICLLKQRALVECWLLKLCSYVSQKLSGHGTVVIVFCLGVF